MEEVLQRLTGTGRNQLLSEDSNTYYRVWTEEASTVVKFYGTTSQYRREHRALESLEGIPGLPTIVDQGLEDGKAWVQFLDAGRWSLATMPENTGAARLAGEILYGVHEAGSTGLDVASSIGSRLARAAVAVKLDGEMLGKVIELTFPRKLLDGRPDEALGNFELGFNLDRRRGSCVVDRDAASNAGREQIDRADGDEKLRANRPAIPEPLQHASRPL